MEYKVPIVEKSCGPRGPNYFGVDWGKLFSILYKGVNSGDLDYGDIQKLVNKAKCVSDKRVNERINMSKEELENEIR